MDFFSYRTKEVPGVNIVSLPTELSYFCENNTNFQVINWRWMLLPASNSQRLFSCNCSEIVFGIWKTQLSSSSFKRFFLLIPVLRWLNDFCTYGNQHVETAEIVKWLSDHLTKILTWRFFFYSAVNEDKMPCLVVKTWIKSNRGNELILCYLFKFRSYLCTLEIHKYACSSPVL